MAEPPKGWSWRVTESNVLDCLTESWLRKKIIELPLLSGSGAFSVLVQLVTPDHYPLCLPFFTLFKWIFCYGGYQRHILSS